MAGVSTKEIKNRIRSMQSTKSITKAMEMVAASKLRRAQEQVLASRPYFEALQATIGQIVDANRDVSSAFLTQRPVKKTALIVIAGDRGLAGGYNSNVLKLALSQIQKKTVTVLPIGKKAIDFFRSRKSEVLTELYKEVEGIGVSDCFSIARLLCKGYMAGEFDDVHIAYTNFVSVLRQTPAFLQVLPLHRNAEGSSSQSDILYEPNCTEVFDTVAVEYVGGIIYGALCESRAAEQAARRTAMDSATQNADEMIEDLSLRFNRARQAAITSEIIDIIAGS